MKRIPVTIIILIIVLIVSASATNLPVSGCPVVKIKSPDSVFVGESINLLTELTGDDPQYATYNWQLTKGMIEKGQGTSEITIDTTGITADENITITLDVGGYGRQCIKETYGITRIVKIVKK